MRFLLPHCLHTLLTHIFRYCKLRQSRILMIEHMNTVLYHRRNSVYPKNKSRDNTHLKYLHCYNYMWRLLPDCWCTMGNLKNRSRDNTHLKYLHRYNYMRWLFPDCLHRGVWVSRSTRYIATPRNNRLGFHPNCNTVLSTPIATDTHVV